MMCHEVERRLDSYIDGELDDGIAAVVREHLSVCGSCRQRLSERDALGRMLRSVAYYKAPAGMRARLSGQVQRTRSNWHLLAWATAAVLVVSIAGAMSLVWSAAVRDEHTVSDVVDGHVRSLMAGHLFDVRSTDQHTVKPWFLGKLDFSPPVVDLASIGFPLVGGRLDYVSGRPVAALVYQRQQHVINVFIWPNSSSRATADGWTVRGFHVRHWLRDGMSLWAVSDLNDTDLGEFVRALRTM